MVHPRRCRGIAGTCLAWLPLWAWLLLSQASQAHADPDTDTHTGDGVATIYVVRRGWHIDVGLAVPELAGPLRAVAQEFPGARYLLFGFGDRRYFMTKHFPVPAMLAALWPGKSLILATGLVGTPAEAFGEKWVMDLKVSNAQSTELQGFIAASLRVKDAARPPDAFFVVAPGPYPGSLYLDSDLKYSAFHTCNTWVAEGLARAELPVRPRGTLFAGQLWRQVRDRKVHEGPAPAASTTVH